MKISKALEDTPIVASLRGMDPAHAASESRALASGGIRVFEVIVRNRSSITGPLPPQSLQIIAAIRKELGDTVDIVAGSVMQLSDLKPLMDQGVTVFLSTCFSPALVEGAAASGGAFIPGVETVSEAMEAHTRGAIAVKLFPCIYRESGGHYTYRHTPGFVKYLSAFLPIPIIPSGDFGLEPHIADYFSAGALALNIGRQLFSTGVGVEELQRRAAHFSEACRRAVVDNK